LTPPGPAGESKACLEIAVLAATALRTGSMCSYVLAWTLRFLGAFSPCLLLIFRDVLLECLIGSRAPREIVCGPLERLHTYTPVNRISARVAAYDDVIADLERISCQALTT
jgi:hypothetical protein